MSSHEPSGPGGAAAFIAALDRQAAVARRYDRPGAVIVIGSRDGDERAGRAAAAAVGERLRRTDLVGRLSRMELGVLLLEAAPGEAAIVARDLAALVARVTDAPAAAGVVSFPAPPDGPRARCSARRTPRWPRRGGGARPSPSRRATCAGRPRAPSA